MKDAMLWQIELLGLLAESDVPGIRQQDKQAIRDVLADLEALRARCAELEGERDNAVRYSEMVIAEWNRANTKVEQLQREVRAHAAEAEAFRNLAYQVTGLQAERDAAKAELAAEENNCPYPDFSCGTFAAERGIELRPAGGPTYTTTVDHWRGILRDLDAARAGEARAVEVLKGVAEKARWILLDQCVKRGHDPRSAIGDWSLNVGDYLRDEIEGMAFMLDAQPALAWLAQQRREAAAEELERMCVENEERFGTHFMEMTTDSLRDRAAALRAGKGVGDAE
jgi:hypothetical protein